MLKSTILSLIIVLVIRNSADRDEMSALLLGLVATVAYWLIIGWYPVQLGYNLTKVSKFSFGGNK